jgi:hypothetical protein
MAHIDGEPPEPLPPGRRIVGRFEIQAAKIQTSFGWVYKVRDIIRDRTLAVCVLSTSLRDDAGISRFSECVQRAAQGTVGSRFHGEVDSLGSGEDGEVYAALKFIEGDPAALDVSIA